MSKQPDIGETASWSATLDDYLGVFFNSDGTSKAGTAEYRMGYSLYGNGSIASITDLGSGMLRFTFTRTQSNSWYPVKVGVASWRGEDWVPVIYARTTTYCDVQYWERIGSSTTWTKTTPANYAQIEFFFVEV
jgi:hypothetical protein